MSDILARSALAGVSEVPKEGHGAEVEEEAASERARECLDGKSLLRAPPASLSLARAMNVHAVTAPPAGLWLWRRLEEVGAGT